MLHRHLLLAAASVSLQCLDLRCERPGELVEGVLGAVLLYDKLDMRQASGERHSRVVDGGHLSPEHRLNLIARLDPLDDCEHKIRPAFVRDRTLRSDIDELLDEPLQKVAVRRTDGLQRCLVIDIDGASRDFQARPGSRCPVGFKRQHVVW